MGGQVKQAVIKIVKLALAVGLIVWLVQRGAIDFSALQRLLSPVAALTGATLIFILIYLNNYRWLLLLRGQGFATTVRQTLPLSLIGMFFNYAMPGGVGGDVVKGFYLLQDHKTQRLAAAISILMDRIIGFCMMITTAALALLFSWDKVANSREMTALATGVFAMFCVFIVFYFLALSTVVQRTRWIQWIFNNAPGGQIAKKLYEALHSYRRAPGALVASFGLSLLSQFMLIIFVYLVGRSMGVTEIPFSAYCFLVPVGVVTMSLPLSPAGIGVGQAAFYFLFNLYLGQPSQVGPTAVTALQITQFFWGLFGAYFYLSRGKPKMSEPAASGGAA